jgi:hypothetical protein
MKNIGLKVIAATAALLLIATTASVAGDGYFRHPPPEILAPDSIEASEAIAKESFTCALQVRYNRDSTRYVTLIYLGPWAACRMGFEAAIQVAVATTPTQVAPKVEMPGRPGLPPVYECGADVNFEPATPAQVSVTFTGAGCEPTRAPALRAASEAVVCRFHGYCGP